MNTDLMFSSATDKWNTPKNLIDDLATVFKWDLDVCASSPNVCEVYFTEDDSALSEYAHWNDYKLRWCNPPYGRGIEDWYRAAYDASYDGATVMLVPARTDTKYWHKYVPHAAQVVFIKGRLKFGNATNSAPFPSAFVVFGEINKAQRDKLASYGWSVTP